MIDKKMIIFIRTPYQSIFPIFFLPSAEVIAWFILGSGN